MRRARITLCPDRGGDGTVSVTETHWGCILREAAPAGTVGDLARPALRFLGLILLCAAYVHWLLPARLYPGDPVSAKIGLSALLAVLGAGVYVAGRRASGDEVHVDRAGREIRLLRGGGRVRRRLSFDAVSAARVSREAGARARIALSLRAGGAPIVLVHGAERELLHLEARLARDLQCPVARLEARLRDAGPRRVAVRARARV